jgi:integrase
MCTRRQELRKLIESSPDPCGMPIMSAALKRWKLRCPISKQDNAALRRAKVRQERLHDLRHSFASNLLGAGTDIVTVSKALAHADVHIVLTTHAHAITRERQGVGDALARFMGQNGNMDL